jgi:hypothetical protein
MGKKYRTLEDFPALVKALAKEGELRDKLAAVETRRNDLTAKTAGGKTPAAISASAQLLLLGKEIPKIEDYEAALKQASHEAAVLQCALELQGENVSRSRLQAEEEIRKEQMPGYIEAARDFFQKWQELMKSCKAGPMAILAELRSQGIPIVDPIHEVDCRQLEFQLTEFGKYLHQAGYIKASEIPPSRPINLSPKETAHEPFSFPIGLGNRSPGPF